MNNTREFFSAHVSAWHDFNDLVRSRLLEGTAELRRRKIEVYLSHDLRRLVDFNRDYHKSWGPLFPAMDPHQAGFDVDHGVMIEGWDEHGELVFTDAVRRLDIPHSNLKIEFETMHAYYRDADKQRGLDEWIEVTAPSSTEIAGRVGLVGGLWVAPHQRGRGLTQIFSPLIRWYAHSLWRLDWIAAFVHEGAAKAGVARGYGYVSTEPFIYMRTHAVQSDLHLLSQRRDQLEAHVRAGLYAAVPPR